MGSQKEKITAILKDTQEISSVSRATFDALDIDVSGDLDFFEVCKLVTWLAEHLDVEKPSQPTVSEIFERVDVNNNGSISYEEYETVMVALMEQWIAENKLD